MLLTKMEDYPVHGKCLCGQVAFEIDCENLKLYQCHCSLCRKQSGSSSNTGAIVDNEHFRWLRGQDCISSWVADNGFRSDFCAKCGAPVPNPFSNKAYFWIPAGLLDEYGKLEIVAHLCVDSKAAWDVIGSQGAHYGEVPDLPELFALLHSPE
jgi:hypothetical protein